MQTKNKNYPPEKMDKKKDFETSKSSSGKKNKATKKSARSREKISSEIYTATTQLKRQKAEEYLRYMEKKIHGY